MNSEIPTTGDQEYMRGESLQQRILHESEMAENAYYRRQEHIKPENAAVADDEYKAECAVLPKGFLAGFDISALIGEDFMNGFPYGMKCCAAALPFARNCSDKAALTAGGRWEKFLAGREYLNLMIVNSAGYGRRFNNDKPGYYFEYMPSVLTKDISQGGCTFEIEYPYPMRRGEFLAPSQIESNRAWLENRISSALNNLRAFFGQGYGAELGALPN